MILDNAPSHPPANELVKATEDGLIWVMFMPPNVTPLIQPMDQNAIRLVKLGYRNSLLSKIIAAGTDNISESLKRIDIYDAVSLLALSWDKLPENSIIKCWRNILNYGSTEFDEEENIPIAELIRRDGETVLTSKLTLAAAAFPDVSPWLF